MTEHHVTDPVRSVFEHPPHSSCFNLGGELSPASMRDQILRGCLVVDRALHYELIGDGKPLAVIGAGAAGLAAAIRAAQAGVQTTLFDSEREVASLQLRGAAREIDPTLYDWPATHWALGTLPMEETPPLPLPWPSRQPSIIAKEWIQLIKTQVPSTFRFSPCSKVINVQREGDLWRLSVINTLTNEPLTIDRQFACVILAAGQGTERVSISKTDPYHGYAYWDADLFEQPSYGRDNSRPNILISGGGDGALQDLFRLALHEPQQPGPFSTSRFLQALLGVDGIDWGYIREEIATAELQASRALLWSPHDGRRYDKAYDRSVIERLDRRYAALLTDAFKSKDLPASLSKVIDQWMRRDFESLDIVMRGSCYSPCFAVNRLIAHLLQRFSQRNKRTRLRFRFGTSVLAITPNDHDCTSASSCHMQPHDVKLQHGGSAALSWNQEYHIVVLRHGLDPILQSDGLRAAFGDVVPRRQLLPFHLP